MTDRPTIAQRANPSRRGTGRHPADGGREINLLLDRAERVVAEAVITDQGARDR
jgi:hypothetical protein